MQQSLFRQNAIEHQKDRLHGEVLLTPSLPHVVAAIFVLLWLVAVFAWLVNSQYARQESVTGWLEPTNGISKVYAHDASGHVSKLLVSEGQEVKVGDPLVVVNRGRTMVNGYSVENTLLEEYQKQDELLNAQLLRMQSKNSIEIANTQQELHAIEAELEGISEQIATLKARQDLVVTRLKNFQLMNQRGHITDVEMDNLLEQQLALENDEQRLVREQINRQNQLDLLSSRLKVLPYSQKDNEAQLRVKLSDLALQIAQMRGQKEYVLKANNDGVVSNLHAKEGQQVNASMPLLSIMPNNSQIIAKLLIPVKAAGFIEAGQEIEVRYDAFPYQKFGLYQAEVIQVSTTVLLPNEVNSVPIQFNEPVYLVHANLNSASVEAYGKTLQLKSGMTLTGNIKLSERSLLEWILEPLMSLRGRLQ
ncbi:HlyD family secretion protein [Aliiglaciecola sp. M165]|uniref:HlyD family secretion protein n=1 Tax=Aliiglaciecola sp. M165 TaxID=2593649 RepID=UPI00163D96D3|nr:HlyD family efflux transporter periplasmic adaptor subunit [Aliiglaciecola sp. M165]